MGMTLTGKGEA